MHLDLTKTNEYREKMLHIDSIENHVLIKIPKVQKDNYCTFYL
jgi:hypothetical protein